MSNLRVAFYGDDLTGSIDVLLQFGRAGWRCGLLLGRPEDRELREVAGEVDVVGIAGIARSLGTEALEQEVRPALAALLSLEPRALQYKMCSTADSSPTVGSIGRVLEIARDLMGSQINPVPILAAQPDFGRYTVFGHHFAAQDGHTYRLDRQPAMAQHPVTPMQESDLAVHLSRQTDLDVGHMPWTDYDDAQSMARAMAGRPEAALVMDALHREHVDLVAAAAMADVGGSDTRFVIGSGGLSAGLAHALSHPRDGSSASTRALHPAGPVLVVSGSRSPQTGRQVRWAQRAGWAVISLDPTPETEGGAEVDATARRRVLAELDQGRSVVVLTPAQDVVHQAHGSRAPVDLVGALSTRLSAVVAEAVESRATQRVIVCGGDTSGRVLASLGATSLTPVANPVDNVVLCTVQSPRSWLDGTEVLLKGGQVGPEDLFELVRVLGPASGAPSRF